MPTARRTRTIAAPAEEIWQVVRDPHHLPRWWPRVTRVEDVGEDGTFTEVMRTRKGKTVRADFAIVETDESSRRVRWEQRLEGTPFAGVLRSAETELHLAPGAAPGATDVTIELRQVLKDSWEPRSELVRRLMPSGGSFGGRMVRRAANQTLGEALDGLERISV
jgi:uncharacterized protein YndB with AHSA1/START domain